MWPIIIETSRGAGAGAGPVPHSPPYRTQGVRGEGEGEPGVNGGEGWGLRGR